MNQAETEVLKIRKAKRRQITIFKWKTGAWETNLNKDPESFCDPERISSRGESVYIRKFVIESVGDRLFRHNLHDPILGKCAIEMTFEVFCNFHRIGLPQRVRRRLQILMDTGVICGFHEYHNCLGVVAYFNPVSGEHLTRTALKVAVEFFKVFGIWNYYWNNYRINQETEFQIPGQERWLTYSSFSKLANQDILGKPKKEDIY